ncbi:TIGR03773 family transporter-associated surface protein [Streptomyces sp. NRRL WC-3549]|uniref:TIGR03773 family transporter-associated surface protein n=1 Tax=Streptomyces sp. NRRL WC-3549 TaxID=1463925 RepID=UPI0007C700E7|nr:TIGR03773 family transporter-associated surface protein [Streptomyces sp. NRRL WC-3549]
MTAVRIRRTAASAAAALALTVLPAVAAHADGPPSEGTAEGRTVVPEGHVDMGPRFDEGTWTVQIRDDTARPATWRDPSDVVLQVKDTARTEVPESEEFGFLGDPGAQVWLLPQVQRDGVLWPGWNSQDPRVAADVEREVTWQLTDVQGPGRFVLFLNGSFGTPKVVFDSTKRLPQETGIEVNSHVHGNWAFTAPGTYLLGVRMSATTKDGKRHDGRSTLRFSVGPQSPQKAFTAPSPSSGRAASPEAGPAAGAPQGREPEREDSATPLWLSLIHIFVLVRRRSTHPAASAAATQEGDQL